MSDNLYCLNIPPLVLVWFIGSLNKLESFLGPQWWSRPAGVVDVDAHFSAPVLAKRYASVSRGLTLRPRFCGAKSASAPVSRWEHHIYLDGMNTAPQASIGRRSHPVSLHCSAWSRIRCLYATLNRRRFGFSSTSVTLAVGATESDCFLHLIIGDSPPVLQLKNRIKKSDAPLITT